MCDQRKKSWTSIETLSTSRAISILITIDAEEECERIPLLAGQWRRHDGDDDYDDERQHHHINENEQRTKNNFRLNYGGFGDLKQQQQQRQRQQPENFSSYYADDEKSFKTKNNWKFYHLCDLRLFGIIFILFAGFIIATYLLIIETRLPSTGFTLDLVSHDIWSTKKTLQLGGLLNHTNVVNVLIKHTGGESCFSSTSCIRLLNQMQEKYLTPQMPFELPYNFLVADDGQTYEIRGWNNDAGFNINVLQNSSTIVIGFIGNHTVIPPNLTTLQSTLSLIKESVRRKKLQKFYHIYGMRNITANQNDGEALFKSIIKWPQFQNLINVT